MLRFDCCSHFLCLESVKATKILHFTTVTLSRRCNPNILHSFFFTHSHAFQPGLSPDIFDLLALMVEQYFGLQYDGPLGTYRKIDAKILRAKVFFDTSRYKPRTTSERTDSLLAIFDNSDLRFYISVETHRSAYLQEQHDQILSDLRLLYAERFAQAHALRSDFDELQRLHCEIERIASLESPWERWLAIRGKPKDAEVNFEQHSAADVKALLIVRTDDKEHWQRMVAATRHTVAQVRKVVEQKRKLVQKAEVGKPDTGERLEMYTAHAVPPATGHHQTNPVPQATVFL